MVGVLDGADQGLHDQARPDLSAVARVAMREIREGEVPFAAGTAIQEDPDRPAFRGNGPDDYVCVQVRQRARRVDGRGADDEEGPRAVRALPDRQRRGHRRLARALAALRAPMSLWSGSAPSGARSRRRSSRRRRRPPRGRCPPRSRARPSRSCARAPRCSSSDRRDRRARRPRPRSPPTRPCPLSSISSAYPAAGFRCATISRVADSLDAG